MCTKNPWNLVTTLLFPLIILLFPSPAGFSEETAPLQGEPVPQYAGCETESDNTLRFTGSPGKTDRTFSRMLHAARRAGDHQRLLELEAMIPEAPLTHETAGGTTRKPSTTVWGAGENLPGNGTGANTAGFLDEFGNDKIVNSLNLSTIEYHQSMATDADGNFYVAWIDDDGYIWVYKSMDMGVTWTGFLSLGHFSADLRQPCIAVGDGAVDKLLIAYVIDPYQGEATIEVATSPLSSPSVQFHTVPTWSGWDGYAKPVIWTDSYYYNEWYAYLTCEGIVDSSTRNINVCTWRGTGFGETWGSATVALGNTDAMAWIDPDGSYGTSGHRSFVACFNEDTQTLYTAISDNNGVSYPTQRSINTLPSLPAHSVDPEIEAARYHNHVMLCCTFDTGAYSDSIGQCYSTDAGDTWTMLWALEGYSPMREHDVALTANEGGATWHLSYTREFDHRVMYSRRPQDLSDHWQDGPDVVDDLGYHSTTFAKKGIASTWDSDICGIAWADIRDSTHDHDTYFDLNREIFVPQGVPTIQGAINAALDGFTIYVDAGNYTENLTFMGKALTVESTAGAPDTVIDGNQAGTVVSFNNGEGYDTLLRGFTLINGWNDSGGGVYCNGTSPRLENLVITECGGKNGAGLFSWYADPTVSYCTFYHNSATIAGGAVYSHGTSMPLIQSCIFWNNQAPSGPEIHLASGNILVVNSDVQGGWPGTGNIDQEPRFVNPAAGDFHLSWTSPCINRGGALNGPMVDFEGDIRGDAGWVDMGADEFTGVRSLEADAISIPISGGQANLDLDARPANAGRIYLILGSLSGPSPGTPLPGGQAVLPINWDGFTDVVLSRLNTGVLQNFLGILDGNGRASARINLPAVNPSKLYKWMTYAYCLEGAPDWDFASCPIRIEFVP